LFVAVLLFRVPSLEVEVEVDAAVAAASSTSRLTSVLMSAISRASTIPSMSIHSFTLSTRSASFCSCEDWWLSFPSRHEGRVGRESVFRRRGRGARLRGLLLLLLGRVAVLVLLLLLLSPLTEDPVPEWTVLFDDVVSADVRRAPLVEWWLWCEPAKEGMEREKEDGEREKGEVGGGGVDGFWEGIVD